MASAGSGSIGGLLFLDDDHNATHTDDETPIIGAAVQLSFDADSDGEHETSIGEATADAQGAFSFAQLEPGAYELAVQIVDHDPSLVTRQGLPLQLHLDEGEHLVVRLGFSDDADGDGLSTAEEAALGTDPRDRDSDHDEVRDGGEQDMATDPLDPDSDNDGIADGDELFHETDPNRDDSDEDGLTDGEEVALGTDPTSADSDGDALEDADEIALGTSPSMDDSDGDGIDDATEIGDVGNPADSDGDRVLDALDDDSDGDGLSDSAEAAANHRRRAGRQRQRAPVHRPLRGCAWELGRQGEVLRGEHRGLSADHRVIQVAGSSPIAARTALRSSSR